MAPSQTVATHPVAELQRIQKNGNAANAIADVYSGINSTLLYRDQ
jgi:hypothetical protein